MMALYRRDPFDVFRLFSDSLFEDVFGKEWYDSSSIIRSKGYPIYDQWTKEDGTVILEFPLAGFKSSDLSVEVDGNNLVISAQKAEKRQDGVQTVSGRSSQSFSKSFSAVKGLDLENIRASFEDGLLVVEIPPKKVEKPPIKKIEISTNKMLK